VEQLADSAKGSGLFVQRHGDRVQLATAPDAAPYIEQFLEVEHGRLSNASLETLAIVAYRQPVTRGGIDHVRGVNSDAAVATLLARGLIEEVGRAPGPGRPALFGTTVRFLEYFGLSRPDALPPLPAIEGEEQRADGSENGSSNGLAVEAAAEHSNGHADGMAQALAPEAAAEDDEDWPEDAPDEGAAGEEAVGAEPPASPDPADDPDLL
jgi:segregation and condensation protein B